LLSYNKFDKFIAFDLIHRFQLNLHHGNDSIEGEEKDAEKDKDK
jgi:hypothetical protein